MASIISASTTSATALNMSADTTGVLQLATGATPTTAVTIDTSQNVGIGTTSPSAKLDVQAGSTSLPTYVGNIRVGGYSAQSLASNGGIEFVAATSGSGYGWRIGGIDLGSNSVPFVWESRSSSASWTERMRIDSSGNVLIGTTSTTPRDFTSGSGCKIAPSGGTFEFATTDTNCVFFNYTGSASGSATFITFRQQGVTRGGISTNGSTTAYNTTSDYRLKDNIVPITGALDKVALLKPVTYTWKSDGSDGQGFIAHELQEIVPDCVSGEKDAVDDDGKPIYQGVDTSFLVATLTAAIQEQQTIINDLKARVTALEAK